MLGLSRSTTFVLWLAGILLAGLILSYVFDAPKEVLAKTFLMGMLTGILLGLVFKKKK